MISAVILGAGRSSRYGQAKQLLEVGDRTLLETVVSTFTKSMVDEVVVVLGFRADEILRNSKFGRARVTVNADFARGLSSSLKVGVEATDPRTEAFIIALGDHPLLTTQTIDLLVQKYSETRAPIIAPFFNRRRGNPVLFDRSLLAELRKLQGDQGAKELLERMKGKIVKVQVDDLGVLMDIDTKEDYVRFRDKFQN